MKKRIFILSLILALIIGTSLAKDAFAAEYNREHVFDMADLLTDSEEEELRIFAEKYEAYGISIVFMTTEVTGGKTTQNFSNDFYDGNHFRPDGIMFSIDMENREIYIDTVGECIAMISDSRISGVLEDSFEYATEGRYAKCLNEMSESICKVIDERQEPFKSAIKPSPVIIFAMIIVAAGVVLILIAMHNKANKKISANQYIGSTFAVTKKDSLFMGCRKEVIPDYYAEPKDSGGSSSHMSSSGVSHGGGGHKF